VPLLSWYHADFDVAGEGVEAELEGWADRYFCRWPAGLGRIDEALLALNAPHLRDYDAPVITFSHFVPRPELIPAVRFLRFHGLPLVAGSAGIERQLRQVGARVHVFGHTHIPRDRSVDGVRYLHNPFRPVEGSSPLTQVWSGKEPVPAPRPVR
jgi:hypothetical protein